MPRAKAGAALGIAAGIAGFAMAEGVVEERALNVQGVTQVEVRSFNGSIRLAAGNAAPGVRITHQKNVDIVVEKRGNLLYLEGKKRSLVCSRCRVSFELSLPVGLQAKLATSNGAITVNGRVSFSLPGFQVQLERSSFIARQPGEEPTELTLQTSNGPITVR